jgi:hypothetical protein
VESSGKRADQAISAIKAEFKASIESIADPVASDLLVEPIFAAAAYAVALETNKLTSAGRQLPTRIKAEATKMIASIAVASARNTELIRAAGFTSEFMDFEDDMRSQIRSIHGSMKLPHAGTTRQVPYSQLFVAPRLAFLRSDRSDQARRNVNVEDIVQHSTRCVILGDPGGGKSTLALKLAFDVSSDSISKIPAKVPFFVVLRDYADCTRGATRISLVEYLEALCTSPYGVHPPAYAIEYLLLNDRAIVIFDGLDELTDTSLRRDVVQAVEGFAYRYPTTPIVVTSRRIGYEEAPLDADLFPVAQLEEFSQKQVSDYSHMWFALDEGEPPAERKRLTEAFLRDSEFVADLRINPLMLSLMCGIYATENYIPRNRPEVYEKCALLLFERWDKQRGIKIALPFDAHVHAAMRSLALHMYSQEQPQLGRPELVQYIKGYLLEKRFENAEEAESAAEDFIDFCKGRAWVLTDVGHEKYGFTHRTFLEYFSASQLVRLYPGAEQLFNTLRDHLCTQEWDAVAQLALQILGRSVEDGADDFLSITVQSAVDAVEPIRSNLLSFASRALQFIVPRPEVLRAVVASCIRLLSDPTPDARRQDYREIRQLRASAQPALHLLRASSELRPALARLIREETQHLLGESWKKEELLVLAVAPWVLADVWSEQLVRIDWNYWRKWARENEHILATSLTLAQTRYYWLDLMRLYRGEIDVKQLLARHGVASIFDYRIAGYGPYPPIAYSLLGEFRGAFSLLGTSSRQPRGVLAKIGSDLEEALPEMPLPWLSYRRHYFILCDVLHRGRGRMRMSQQLALLLAAPLAELEARAGPNLPKAIRRGGNGKGLLPIILGARTGATEMNDSLEALAQLSMSNSARELLQRWIVGEANFVKPGVSTRPRQP